MRRGHLLWLLSRVDRIDQRLQRLTSVFYLLSAVGAASILAGGVGAILIVLYSVIR
jgi:hypothetical protein